MTMPDGNTAALRDEEQQQSFVDGVFAAHGRQAREYLRDEAEDRITASDINIADVIDHIIGNCVENDLNIALSMDDETEVGRLLHKARDEVLVKRWAEYVEKLYEDRVWDLYNARRYG